MIRMAILGSAAALTLSLPAAAQQYGHSGYGYNGYGQQTQGYYDANCERERRANQTAGGLFGAVAGGLLGAALADGDDDNRYRRGHHRYSRYGRGYHRGYGRGYHRGYGRRHYRDNDDGNKAAGAIAGALIGGVAGSALAGSSTNCNRQAYDRQDNYRYGGSNVPAPTRQPYGNAWENNNARRVTYNNSYSQDAYDLRPGEELYGASPQSNPAWNNPEYGATTQGYNAGYSAPQDTGECRTVYRGNQPATACNVGGDRWEFVN